MKPNAKLLRPKDASSRNQAAIHINSARIDLHVAFLQMMGEEHSSNPYFDASIYFWFMRTLARVVPSDDKILVKSRGQPLSIIKTRNISTYGGWQVRTLGLLRSFASYTTS